MPAWDVNWAWGLPLIVLNVVIHVLGLGLINERVVRALSGAMERSHFTVVFTVGGAAVFAAFERLNYADIFAAIQTTQEETPVEIATKL